MDTKIFKMDPEHTDREAIRICADILKRGGTVAFPTETVYGLGANALDKNAIEKIFTAKGRPSDNPLILHVYSFEEVVKYAEEIPDDALKLADFFSPGPLSMIFRKKSIVPPAATGGLETAAFRVPSNKVALALIEEARLPIAAPSANLSGKPSTTDGSHVIDDLFGRVDAIIDTGRSEIGLESTVVDMTVSPPEVLRPGGVTLNELRMVIPAIKRSYTTENSSAPKSPGMKYRHYSPESPLTIVKGNSNDVIDRINFLVSGNSNIGVLCCDETYDLYSGGKKISVGSINDPGTIASNVFHALRLFDKSGVTAIYSEYFSIGDMEEAVMNRLRKASAEIIQI